VKLGTVFKIDFKIRVRPARPAGQVFEFQAFQAFQEYQEFQEFQEIATHFKSISRDSKRQQEFQEHVSRVTNPSRMKHNQPSLPDVAGRV